MARRCLRPTKKASKLSFLQGIPFLTKYFESYKFFAAVTLLFALATLAQNIRF